MSAIAETAGVSGADVTAGAPDVVDTLPVTGVPRGGLPRRALVVGDPFRAERISRLLGDGKEVAHKREYWTFRGSWNGTEIVVSSHGVGAAVLSANSRS